MNGLLYDSTVTSCYCNISDVMLLQQYSDVMLLRCNSKANYWGADTAYCPCHTISRQSPCHVSDCQSQQRLVFEHGLLHLDFVTLKFWNFALFFPGTYHSLVIILTITLRTHTLTTVHITYSHSDHRPHYLLTLSSPTTLRTHTLTTVHTTYSHPDQRPYYLHSILRVIKT